jgi:hypothetical protein
VPDPDAADYITAIEGAGAIVDDRQKLAIHMFIKAEKSAGRWANIKRLYLPVWGVAAANAIDVVTTIDGTFTASAESHKKGYWRPNGTSEYFDMDVSPFAAGLTPASGSVFALVAASRTVQTSYPVIIGASDAGGSAMVDIHDTLPELLEYHEAVIGQDGASQFANIVGVPSLAGVRFANRNTDLTLYQRTASQFIAGITNTAHPAGPLTNELMTVGASRDTGTDQSYNDSALGAYGMGLGFDSQADVEGFTENLKILWETVSSATLPDDSIQDPETQQFILARKVAGEDPTLAQQQAVQTFIVAEKAAGRWTKMRRLFFPVSGIEAANTVDMVKGFNSATYNFTDAFIHAPGYMLGNGLNSVFQVNASAFALGLTPTSGSLGVLLVAASNSYPCFHISGSTGGTVDLYDWGNSGFGILMDYTGQAGSRLNNLAATHRPGILSGNVVGPLQYSRVRGVQGITAEFEKVFTADGAIPGTNMEMCAKSGVASSGAAYGAMWVGLGMTKAEDAGFTQNLQTLWTTYTGIPFPYAHDEDSRLWCDARSNAGEVMTLNKRDATSAFISAERVGNRWDRMKRFYFTTSAVKAADAIDMVTRTPGTFNGSTTHTPGYVKGDGSTGYFNTGATLAGMGLTLTSASMGVLLLTANAPDITAFFGAQDVSGNDRTYLFNWDASLGILFDWTSGVGTRISHAPAYKKAGILSARVNALVMNLSVRDNAGVPISVNNTITSVTGMYNGNTFCMALNNGGVPAFFTTAETGAWFFATGMSDSENDSFTANLKNFYEVYTGLLIP